MTVRGEFPVELRCPVDHSALLSKSATWLSCSKGHEYPVVEDVPVLLRDDVPQSIWLAHKSWELANQYAGAPEAFPDPLFLDTIGISPAERETARWLARDGDSWAKADPVVSLVIAATSGYLYEHLVGALDAYPIPELRLPASPNALFLDVGCNWGRWTIAAARKKYEVVGIDPSLGAVLAAKRLSMRLGLDNHYVCGDARYLPFAAAQFHNVFSYSVLQHFSKADAQVAFDEAARVLKTDGRVLVQLAHVVGLRSLYHQLRRGFREPEGFDVRYWTIGEMKRALARRFGTPEISVHCYFGLGLEPSDLALVRPLGRVMIRLSEALRNASRFLPPLKRMADSVYVSAVKTAGG